MPNVDLYNVEGKKIGQLELDDAIFGAEVKEHLLYAAVRYQRARARAGTHKAKERAEVRGGGKKPWRQKGTGRARQGTIRAPQWRGGGVVFGPRLRSHAHKLNKKVRKAALFSAVSRRVEEGKCIVIDDATLAEPKTRRVAEFMKVLDLDGMVLVTNATENMGLAARNIPSVTVLRHDGLNVYDVLRRPTLVLTKDAVAQVTKRYKGA